MSRMRMRLVKVIGVAAAMLAASCRGSATVATAGVTAAPSSSACTPAAASDTFTCNEKRIVIESRSGVTLAFDLVEPSSKPKRAVILLSGGDGKLSLTDRGMDGGASKNFVVRTRQAYASAGLVAAVPDAPSDQPNGLDGDFRSSEAHAEDMRALIVWLDANYHVPVWMVSTSRGTISAANAAARLGAQGPKGIVLTSPVTVSEKGKDSLERVDLTKITVPCDVISHADDGCPASPHDGAKAMGKAHDWPFSTPRGGSESCTDTKCRCGPASHHGFEGLDGEVMPTILAFVNGEGR